mgnify:CR=1 FL=1
MKRGLKAYMASGLATKVYTILNEKRIESGIDIKAQTLEKLDIAQWKEDWKEISSNPSRLELVLCSMKRGLKGFNAVRIGGHRPI